MSENKPNSANTSDEIDLGQLLKLTRKILSSIFFGILCGFLFLKRNAFKLIGLIIIGVAIGFLLNTQVVDKLQTEAIVKPNFESKDYLYDVVDELKSKVIAKDTLFFKNIGIDLNEFRKFEIEIEPIEDLTKNGKSNSDDDNEYLEILQNFKDNDFVLDIVKSEILKKSIRTHRLIFTHKNAVKGEEFVTKILVYINANPYFNELQNTYKQNAMHRIKQNDGLIKQIDEMVMSFSASLKNNQNTTGQSMVLLEGESGLNVPSLLMFKNRLIKENEAKQVELIEQRSPVSVLSLGKTHVVRKQILSKNFVLIPLLLIGLFFLVSFISFLNRKSKEL